MWRRIVMGIIGMAAGVAAGLVIQQDPAYSLTDGSVVGLALLLLAGWSLVAASLVVSFGRWHEAALVLAIAVVWFAVEWTNPTAISWLFTIGLVLSAALPATVLHLAWAVTAVPAGRVLVAVGYLVTVAVQGLGVALTFDPVEAGCSTCPHNPLFVGADPGAWLQVSRAGLRLELGWLVAALLVLLWWLARTRSGHRGNVGARVALTIGTLGISAAYVWHSIPQGFPVHDPLARTLWAWQAGALTALAAAVVGEVVLVHRARSELASLVSELRTTDVSAGLGSHLGDPAIVLAYPVAGGYIDSTGRPTDPTARGRRVTLARRGGSVVAAVGHRPDLDPRRVTELAEAVGLALDNERLNAEARAQVEAIRASGLRVLTAGDAERRRLERDLHDGAQQNMVMLLLRLGMTADHHPPATVAEVRLRQAVVGLRGIAHGLHPVLLERAGLGPGLMGLAEGRPVTIGAVPDRRFAAVVESTVYLLAERCCATSPAAISISLEDGLLRVEAEIAGEPGDLTTVSDRITTLDGSLSLQLGMPTTVRASIPDQPT